MRLELIAERQLPGYVRAVPTTPHCRLVAVAEHYSRERDIEVLDLARLETVVRLPKHGFQGGLDWYTFGILLRDLS